MEGRPLSHLELMTIAQKDEQYYRDWIGEDVQLLAQRCVGVRRWIQLRNAITVLSRFGYFAATNLALINNGTLITPTLGEEFCGAQVEEPNLMKSLIMIALNNELQAPKELPRSYAKLVKDVHLVTFFLFGDFYELSKRLSNYFHTTGDTNLYQSERMTLLYRVVGCMSLVKLLIDILKETQHENLPHQQSKITNESKVSEPKDTSPSFEGDKPADASTLCHLCSEQRTEPTSTLCGHIFCWDCIHRWLRERSECPICRTPTEPSRLIHLINFR